MDKKIKIKVYDRKTKDGKPFKAYRAVTKNGVLMDARFRKDVKDLPEVDSYVTIPEEAMNISRRDEYPKLWISKVIKIEPVGDRVFTEEDSKELSEVFG